MEKYQKHMNCRRLVCHEVCEAKFDCGQSSNTFHGVNPEIQMVSIEQQRKSSPFSSSLCQMNSFFPLWSRADLSGICVSNGFLISKCFVYRNTLHAGHNITLYALPLFFRPKLQGRFFWAKSKPKFHIWWVVRSKV